MTRLTRERSLALVCIVAAGFLSLACRCLSDEDSRTIEEWVHCDECMDGERTAVRALGDCAVPVLADRLRRPTPRLMENMRRRAIASYVPGGPLSLDDYVGRMLENYVALSQKRAASGLEAIGTPRAREELRRALDSTATRGYRSDVVRAIQGALAEASFGAFDGSLSDTSLSFGDTVRVHRGSLSWSGDESVILNGAPFPDDVFVRRWSADSFSFVAVAERGSYKASINSLGSQADTQIVPLRIVSLRYETHSPSTAPLVTGASLSERRFLVLRTRPNDTTDHFRVAPVATLSVTATAETPGSTAPFLRWLQCVSVAPVALPDPSKITGHVVTSGGTGIPNAQIRVLSTTLGAVSNSTGQFTITGIPAAVTATGFVSLRLSRSGFQPRTVSVQAGDDIQVSLSDTSASAGTAITHQASTIVIPSRGCRLLQVGVRAGGPPRIVRLRLASP